MSYTRFAPFVAIALFSGLSAPPARAQTSRLLGYQGRLLRADGTAASGTATVPFAVFAAEPGVAPLWPEKQTLWLSGGYYATFLGLVAPPPDSLFDGAPRWLELKVGTETLLPRQRIGSVLHAVTANNVVGGTASVQSLAVGGQTVIDSAGRLAGTARYVAGAGLVVDDAVQTVALKPCASGQILLHDDSTWGCAPAGTGAVTGVGAAAPLGVTGESGSPVLSIARASSGSSGYLASADYGRFDAKFDAATQCGGDLSGSLSAPAVVRLQSRPVSATAPATGQVLKWGGTAWEPGTDANSGGTVTSVTGVAPLSVWNGSATPQISIGQASASMDGYLASADYARFDAKPGLATQCGGDLDGTFGSPVVAKLQGFPVVSSAPASAQVLRYDGSRWSPASLGIADVGGLSSGYVDLNGTQTIAGAKTFSAAPTFGSPLAVAGGGTGASSVTGNLVFASPDGITGAPGFRSLAATDLPGHDTALIISGTLAVARGGTGATSVAANAFFAGPSGTSGAPAFRALVAADIPADIAVGSSGSVAWSAVTGRPTTLSGYGITDAFPADGTLAGLVRSTAAGSSYFTGGNVGIGTAAPAYRLDVQGGDVNVSGAVRAGTFLGDGSGLTSVTASAALQVSDTNTTCTSGQTGQFRYANGHFQGCNGANWTQLDNAPAPSISTVSPASGPTAGGTQITVSGANFQPLATATIGGVNCPVVGNVTATTLVCTTPPGATGPRTVVVVNPDSQNGQKVDAFTYVQPPSVATINPTSGPTAGGTAVTITGTNFQSNATASLGGAACTVTGTTTATVLQCNTTTRAGGTVSLVVTNGDGQTDTKTNAFTYVPPPSISSLGTTSGPTRGGNLLTINGSNFSGSTVKVGTLDAAVQSVNSTTITATMPQSTSTGGFNVVVRNGDNQQSTGTYTYTYVASGDTSAMAVKNCKAVLDAGGSPPDGVYWIKPQSTAFQLFCDMTFDGGGWTLVAQGCDPNSSATGTIRTDPRAWVGSNWKLSDADIDAARTAGTYQILIRGTYGSANTTSRLFQTSTAWNTTVSMSGMNQWNGSSFVSWGNCGEDRGPSACQGAGYYFTGNNKSSVSGCASDFRWYYPNWTNKCLLRTLYDGDSANNGVGVHSTLVR